MFVDTTDPSEPFAAMVKDGTPEEITTNGAEAPDDAATAAATNEAARDAGVHHLATDRPADDGGPWWLDLRPRCNPVTAPPQYTDDEVERP
jgi:hypothetical protein